MSSLFSLPALAILLLALLSLLVYFRRIADYALRFLRMQLSLRWFLYRGRTVADEFESRVAASPDALALVFEGRKYSYAALHALSSRAGLWALQQGLGPRSRVALLMDNRPAFVELWLGLAKLGATAALLNTNLKRQSLLHCLSLCEARVLIVGEECLQAVREIRAQLPPNMEIWVHREQRTGERDRTCGNSRGFASDPASASASSSSHGADAARSAFLLSDPSGPLFDLTAALDCIPAADALSHDFARGRRDAQLGPSDLLFLIFTSGTTGLPKAAKIKHMRWSLTSASFVNFFGLRSSDRIYCCLPLYHSSGGMIGFACAWHTGASVLLSRKFSARGFWPEASREGATVVQYIGQLARYLMAAAPSPADRAHSVRMALGNGMPDDLWRAFQLRFHVPRIAEFYASTEGNANLVNHLDLPGVIGWIPPIAKLLYPLRIVRFDTETEMPVRVAANDGSGSWCVQCAPGETGELLARIDSLDPARSFDGYTSAAATRSKILCDVFRKGDQYFRSGDLVCPDAEGFIRFRDRIGDTFRFKGENVSTMEVAAVISAFESPKLKRAKAAVAAAAAAAEASTAGRSSSSSSPARDEDFDLEERAGLLPSSVAASAASSPCASLVVVREVTVYGVAVAGNDGRAGMASVVLARFGDGGGDEGGEEGSAAAQAQSSEDPAALQSEFDFAAFYSYLHSHLPSYQIPFFLRLQRQLDCTTTFKPKKTELVAEGFDPRAVHGDPLLFRDEQKRAFVTLDAELYQRIQSGLVRL